MQLRNSPFRTHSRELLKRFLQEALEAVGHSEFLQDLPGTRPEANSSASIGKLRRGDLHFDIPALFRKVSKGNSSRQACYASSAACHGEILERVERTSKQQIATVIFLAKAQCLVSFLL